MKQAGRWLAGAAAALLLALAPACSDDEKHDQSGSPEADTGRAAAATATATLAAPSRGGGQRDTVVADDCLAGVKTYRYDGRLQVTLPGNRAGDPSGGVRNISFRGAVVAPDREYAAVDLERVLFQSIAVGRDTWMRMAGAAWMRSGSGVPDIFTFSPGGFCRTSFPGVNRAGIKPARDRVNGTDALRYEFDKQAIVTHDIWFGRSLSAAGVRELPDDARLLLWVTEKEHWLLKLTAAGGQTAGAGRLSFSFEASITDFNRQDITVEAPP